MCRVLQCGLSLSLSFPSLARLQIHRHQIFCLCRSAGQGQNIQTHQLPIKPVLFKKGAGCEHSLPLMCYLNISGSKICTFKVKGNKNNIKINLQALKKKILAVYEQFQ